MSFISSGVEYGLHCLLFLASPDDGAAAPGVRDLADLQGIPAEYLAKIFTKLAKAGLVIATEGARGGFALARPPQDISVLDVVEAIDGKKPLFECREIRPRCALFEDGAPTWATTGPCSIHSIMLNAEQCMRDELSAHSLADLAARVAAKAPAEFGHQVASWLNDRTSSRRADR